MFNFSQQKIFIEYIMLDGVNDQEQHAHQLGKLLETLQVVSLIFDCSYSKSLYVEENKFLPVLKHVHSSSNK